MSLFGTMNTSVSGMNAQSNKLSVVGDNIANADTIGYKRSTLQFSSLLLPSSNTSYSSGSVQTVVRHAVGEQGNLLSTGNGSDLAIKGNGFFVVRDSAGGSFLTRAGSFRLSDTGDMVNAAGFTLMGYSYDHGNPVTQINGLTGMVPINLADGVPRATKTSNVTLGANLDSRKDVVAAARLPSTNSVQATYSSKTSVIAYDSAGTEVKYDVYLTKMADAVNGTPPTDAKWEVSIYRADQAATGGGFPYASGPIGSMTLDFDPATRKVTNTNPHLSISDSRTVPTQTIAFNFANCTNLASDFVNFENKVDGSKASTIKNIAIDTDGTVYAVYSDGTREPRYRIPLAQVASPDNLTPLADNIYSQSPDSGVLYTGFPGSGSFGTTISGSLESSNVDMANELTDMIQAQRNYTANSKVFQTGADLMDILVNLKR